MALTASAVQLSHGWAVDGTSSTGMTPEGGFKRDLPPKLQLTSWWTWWGSSDEWSPTKPTPEVVWDTQADHIDRVFVWEGHNVSSIDGGEEMKRAKTSAVVFLNWSQEAHFYSIFAAS